MSRVTAEMRRMTKHELEWYAAEQAAWVDDYRRQIASLQEAIRDNRDRDPGPIGLERALHREGWEIASSSGGLVVIRERREAGRGE